jgi:SAM-dependent methyltransferase
MGDARERIYRHYTTAREKPLVPATLAGLAPRMPYFRKIIRHHFPPNRNAVVLELGCGHGAFLHAMHEAGYTRVKGVDWAQEQVDAARDLGIAGVEQGDAQSALAATDSGSIDVIVTFDLIEHLKKSELLSLVDEVRRVLRPGGRWIIHAPNGESPLGGRIRYGDFTHELAFTRSSLTQLLKASGFARVRCYEDQPVPHGLKSAARLALWRLIRWGLLAYVTIETGSFDRASIFSQNLLAVAELS